MHPEQPSVQCQNWLSGFLKAVISPGQPQPSQTRSRRQCQALAAQPLQPPTNLVWQIETSKRGERIVKRTDLLNAGTTD